MASGPAPERAHRATAWFRASGPARRWDKGAERAAGKAVRLGRGQDRVPRASDPSSPPGTEPPKRRPPLLPAVPARRPRQGWRRKASVGPRTSEPPSGLRAPRDRVERGASLPVLGSCDSAGRIQAVGAGPGRGQGPGRRSAAARGLPLQGRARPGGAGSAPAGGRQPQRGLCIERPSAARRRPRHSCWEGGRVRTASSALAARGSGGKRGRGGGRTAQKPVPAGRRPPLLA